jgi:hypothetical protein
MLLDLSLLCSMSLSSLFLTDSHLVSYLLSLVRMGDVWVLLLANGSHNDLILLVGSRSEGLICRKLALVKRCHLLMLVEIISLTGVIRMLKSILLLTLLWLSFCYVLYHTVVRANLGLLSRETLLLLGGGLVFGLLLTGVNMRFTLLRH